MAGVTGFPPILPRRPKTLILGSMPSAASLRRKEYYAHPANAFWPVMGSLLNFPADQPYRNRTAALRKAGIALWDVLAYCERKGSLDSDIVRASEKPNPIGALLERHRNISAVFLNGGKAEAAFKKHIAPTLSSQTARRVTVTRLPSTSPANARMGWREKAQAWALVKSTTTAE